MMNSSSERAHPIPTTTVHRRTREGLEMSDCESMTTMGPGIKLYQFILDYTKILASLERRLVWTLGLRSDPR
jgi:hypothetical protein